MPCWELFDAQPQAYRDRGPSAGRDGAHVHRGRRRRSAGRKYVGDRGFAFGIDHFGTSAPAAAIAKAYGFTPDNVADLALKKFALAAR